MLNKPSNGSTSLTDTQTMRCQITFAGSEPAQHDRSQAPLLLLNTPVSSCHSQLGPVSPERPQAA